VTIRIFLFFSKKKRKKESTLFRIGEEDSHIEILLHLDDNKGTIIKLGQFSLFPEILSNTFRNMAAI